MAKEKYQVWWTDDRGARLQQLDEFAFLNYTRIVNGQGILNIGLPYAKYGNIYRKDYRVEVWRAPNAGEKRRLENIFFMQKGVIRTRQEDDVTILEMSGHDPVGMLSRRIEKFRSGTSQATKTDLIDDMMKEIVDEQMGAAASADDPNRSRPYDAGQFTVQADSGMGASITKSFAFRNMLTVLRELSENSQTSTPPIYFDVVPVTPTLFEFQTFVNQRGGDKRFSAGKSSFLFSLKRGNLQGPELELNAFDEENAIYVAGQGEGANRAVELRRDTALELSSLWGRRELLRDARSESTTAGLQAVGDEELAYYRPKNRFVANFLDVPASRYGIDWDLGNRHTVNYAGQQFDIDIKIVYVTLTEDGAENIYGRNEFGLFGE